MKCVIVSRFNLNNKIENTNHKSKSDGLRNIINLVEKYHRSCGWLTKEKEGWKINENAKEKERWNPFIFFIIKKNKIKR